MRVKRLFLFLLALVLSLLLSEAIICYVLKYPDYGISRFIYGISSSTKWQPWYRPHSRYLNNEVRGFHVYARNNLGLPGTDVDTAGKPILILGSSFIEAAQIEPEKMASSVCQREIQKRMPEYSVLNLGRKAHDLYDSWFRYQYYKQVYPPDTVILILDQRNSFDRHQLPLNFDLPQGFGMEDQRIIKEAGNLALSSSSLLALLYRGFRDKKDPVASNTMANQQADQSQQAERRSRDLTLACVKACLEKFSQDAHDKLIVISMFDKAFMNRAIDDWCDSLGIFHVSSDDVQTPAYQLKRMGHLNEAGNARLGKLAASAFFAFKDVATPTSRH